MKPGDKAHNRAHYRALGEVKNESCIKKSFCKIRFSQVITDEVYKILETEGGLERREVVLEAGNRNLGPRSFVFVSPGFQEKERLQVAAKRLSHLDRQVLFQVLIHGSGVVRAGQWTRKLIMNEDLDHGSVLPFLRLDLHTLHVLVQCTSSPREAKEKDWGVCVMNPNLNDIAGESIEGSEEPEEHGKTVWRTMVTPAKASKVAFV